MSILAPTALRFRRPPRTPYVIHDPRHPRIAARDTREARCARAPQHSAGVPNPVRTRRVRAAGMGTVPRIPTRGCPCLFVAAATGAALSRLRYRQAWFSGRDSRALRGVPFTLGLRPGLRIVPFVDFPARIFGITTP